MTNQPKDDTLKVPCTSEGPAKIKNTTKRQVMEPYNHTSERAMQANMEGMGDNQGGVQDGQEGGGTDRGAEGPGHRVGAGQGRHSSSAQGGKLFCAKTRKLRNVRRDKLKQLSLKNFTVKTLRNYGGGPPGENGNGLDLNSYLGQSDYERQGPGRGCESERDELQIIRSIPNSTR